MTVVTEDLGAGRAEERKPWVCTPLVPFLPSSGSCHAARIPLLKLVAPLGTFQMHILKSSPPEPPNVIALGERAFKEVTK